MSSTFDIFSIKTVPSNYSWDKGTPTLDFNQFVTSLSACSAVSNNNSGVEYIGYAPFVFVSLSSAPGQVSYSNVALRRTADFGDFYNSDSNFVTTTTLSSELLCHAYIMPGLYTIRFERTEYIEISSTSLSSNNNLYIQQIGDQGRPPLSWQWYNFLCNSTNNAYNTPIPWLSSGFQQPEQLTWAGSSGPCVSLRQTEQITWTWNSITCNLTANQYASPITWDETKISEPRNTTWDYVQINCSESITPALSSSTQTIVREAFVRVLEIPPTAYLDLTQPVDRTSPLTVRISPKSTVCGSFPIEKIVWDLGDGSPLLTQRRWSNTLEDPFVYSGFISEDYQDPRNYDVIHTYTRTPESGFCFYPSITAYASSTNSSDCVAIMVGPLTLPTINGNDFKLLQNELTEHGKVLIGQVNNDVAVWRTDK
jgi:hypothetical protein